MPCRFDGEIDYRLIDSDSVSGNKTLLLWPVCELKLMTATSTSNNKSSNICNHISFDRTLSYPYKVDLEVNVEKASSTKPLAIREAAMRSDH